MNADSPFYRFPVLQSARLRLRQLRQEDADAIFAYKSRTDEEYFPRVTRHDSLNVSLTFVQSWLAKYYTETGICWSITIPPDDIAVGTLALSAMHGDSSIFHRAEISGALSSELRGKRIMPEAWSEVIAFAFSRWSSLGRIHSEVATTNAVSIKMNKNLGFKHEGDLHGYERSCTYGGQSHDIAVFALLRSDWEARSQ